jgi:ABC-type sugar transport system substrate-binding protein
VKNLTKSVLTGTLVVALLFAAVSCDRGKSDQSSQRSGEAVRGAVEYEMIPFLSDYTQYRYDGEINVLYLVCTTWAEYFPNSHAVWEPLMKTKGINIDLLGPPTFSDESLISTMESALQSGKYDIIVLYPITPWAITPLLDDVWNTYKTPILAYAFAPETGCGHYYLGTSYYQGGVTMGRSIVEYVNDNAAYYDNLDTIPVAIYMQTAAVEQYQRIRGAWDVLVEDGRFSLIQEYEANGDAQCLNATETVLMTRPDVEVILCQIDSDIPGVYQALTSGNYTFSDYLSVWGFDATGVVCSFMAQDGVDGYVQGSAFIDHWETEQALSELIPILVGAAKQDVLIPFTPEQVEEMGTWAGRHYMTVTPKNVGKYWPPK